MKETRIIKERIVKRLEGLSVKELQEVSDFVEFLRLHEEQWFINYVNKRTQEAILARKAGKRFISLEELQKEFPKR
ncbi:MAG: hypothetical protein HY347_08040 [candidate division NC10 bacterium]|nr:hypothetical protein [candidate division NC10 bacterium]